MHLSEHLFADDTLMIIFNVVLRKLSGVFLMNPGQDILGKGLLQQYITAVFFILQDTLDALRRPCSVATSCERACCFQLCLDALQAVALQVAVENQPNDFSLFRDDFGLAVCSLFVADDSAIRKCKFSVLMDWTLRCVVGERITSECL